MTLAQLFSPADSESWSGTYAQVLEAFEEVSLLSTKDAVELDDVLRLVGRRLCELLASSRCSVYLRQSDGTFKGQVGFSSDRNIDASIRKLVAGIANDQFTAEIVSSARPVIIGNAASDPRTIQRTMRRWGVLSMLGVPLVVDREVIGVIYVDNEKVSRDYSDHDVQVAQAFAGLAALVVRQSWLQTRLRDNASVIDRQRTVLSESSLVHSRVTKAVLDGSEISEIVSLISSLLRQHAVLYTPSLEVIAWSSADGIMSGPCPALTKDQAGLPLVQNALRSLHAGEPSIMIQATRELRHRRLMAALLVDHQCVGYLELCESGSSFDQVHRRAIEQAAMALALRTLATQRSEVLSRQERELYFSDLIYGRRDGKGLVDRAADFGVDVGKAHTVLLLQYERRVTEARLATSTNRAMPVDVIEPMLPDNFRVVASTSIPGADLMLIETDSITAGSKAEEAPEEGLARHLSSHLPVLAKRLNVRFCVLSETCTQLLQVAGAARQARQVSGMVAKAPEHLRVVTTKHFDLLRLVGQRTGINGAAEYADDLLAPITDYDAAHNTCLETTLRTFIACDAQLRRTSVALGIHENTVRYRLAKVREISSIWPDRLESLARAAVAIQVRELLNPTSEWNSAEPSLEPAP